MPTHLYAFLSILLRPYDVDLTVHRVHSVNDPMCCSLNEQIVCGIVDQCPENWIVDVKTIVFRKSDVPSFPVSQCCATKGSPYMGEPLVKSYVIQKSSAGQHLSA